MPIPLGILAVAGAGAGGGGAYDLLETTLITTNTASITFSNLNNYSDYKHLQLRATLKDGYSGGGLPYSAGINIYFNGNNTGYAKHHLKGNGSSVSSTATTSASVIEIDAAVPNPGSFNANQFGAAIIDILDFSSSNKNTTIRALSGGKNDYEPEIILTSGFWNNTAAVTSLTFYSSLDTWASGTRVSLYGIK